MHNTRNILVIGRSRIVETFGELTILYVNNTTYTCWTIPKTKNTLCYNVRIENPQSILHAGESVSVGANQLGIVVRQFMISGHLTLDQPLTANGECNHPRHHETTTHKYGNRFEITSKELFGLGWRPKPLGIIWGQLGIRARISYNGPHLTQFHRPQRYVGHRDTSNLEFRQSNVFTPVLHYMQRQCIAIRAVDAGQICWFVNQYRRLPVNVLARVLHSMRIRCVAVRRLTRGHTRYWYHSNPILQTVQ